MTSVKAVFDFGIYCSPHDTSTETTGSDITFRINSPCETTVTSAERWHTWPSLTSETPQILSSEPVSWTNLRNSSLNMWSCRNAVESFTFQVVQQNEHSIYFLMKFKIKDYSKISNLWFNKTGQRDSCHRLQHHHNHERWMGGWWIIPT